MASNGELIGPGDALIYTGPARSPGRDDGRTRRPDQAPTSFPGSPAS